MPRDLKGYIKFIFLIALTAGIYIFLFHKINLFNINNLIKKIDFKIILLPLAVSIINNILISSYRWKLILGQLGCSVSWKDSLFIKMGSNSMISMFPFKSGEFSRVLYLKCQHKIPFQKSSFSIISEYLLNILLLVSLIFIGGLIYCYFIYKYVFFISGSIIFIWVFLLILCPRYFNFYTKAKNRLRDSKYFSFLKQNARQFINILQDRNIIFYSFLYCFLELANICLLSKVAGLNIPLSRILLFSPLVILISGVPITIGGMGMREATIIFFFSKYSSLEVLLFWGLLYSFVEHLFPMLLSSVLTANFLKKILYNNG